MALMPTLNFLLIISLLVGSACSAIAQFYGVIGLIQSNPNNSDFASAAGSHQGSHGPWIEGRALSTWLGLGWMFGLIGAGAAGAVWRVCWGLSERRRVF